MNLTGKVPIVFCIGFLCLSRAPFGGEKEIPLSQVPREVISTAQNEIQGIKLIEAEVITKDNGKYVMK